MAAQQFASLPTGKQKPTQQTCPMLLRQHFFIAMLPSVKNNQMNYA